MNLYTGNPDTDDNCVATDLEQRYRMFLAEGFTPGEAAREAKEIIKFEWLVDQGRDQDQAALLVQMPLRSMMMTTFFQKPADLGYPARIQWLLDRGLYTFEEATVLAFHSFDVLVVMHDEEEVAAGRQHRIQDYFACNRRRRLRPASIHPLASVKGERAKVAAVKPTFREKEIKPVGSVPPVAPAPSPSAIFANLDRYLSAPDPMPEEEVKEEPPPVPEMPVEVKPTISNVKPEPVVAKKAKITPTAKPSFKWSWKSSRANLSTVASAFGQEDEGEATTTLTKMVVPEPETVSTEEASKSKAVVPDIPKVFNVPPPPLPIPPPTGSKTLDPALLTQPIFAWVCPIIPAAVPEVTPEPPPLPPEMPKPPEPEPEPEPVNPALEAPTSKPKAPRPEEQPRPIQSLGKPSTSKPPSQPTNLKWSSPIPTINTCGNNIVITPTPTVERKTLLPTPQPTDEFSLNWDKAWGEAAASSDSQQSARWANFKLVEGVEEDPDDPYGVKLLNRRPVVETVERPASPANKVDDMYAMMNRFQ